MVVWGNKLAESLQYLTWPLDASVVSVTVCLERRGETGAMGDESHGRAGGGRGVADVQRQKSNWNLFFSSFLCCWGPVTPPNLIECCSVRVELCFSFSLPVIQHVMEVDHGVADL